MKSNQKSMFVTIAAIAFVIILVYGLVVYLFIAPKGGNDPSTEVAAADVGSLNPSNVRLDLQDGNVSSDKNLIVILKMSGLGNKETVDELRKSGNVTIEINGDRADINNTESPNEDSLLITAQTRISDEKYRDFNDGKLQSLEIRANINYKSDSTASKYLSTEFQKGTKSSSLGQEIVFGTKTGPGVTDPRNTSTTAMQTPNANKSEASNIRLGPAEVTRNRDNPRTPVSIPPPRPTSTIPAVSDSEQDLIRRMKNNNIVRKNSNSNSN